MAVESTQSDRELVERGWAALPPEYRVPDRRPTLEEAHDYCRRLAESHYENFHVASWFLPRRLSRGGLEILHAIERQDYDVLRNRPAISKGRNSRSYCAHSARNCWLAWLGKVRLGEGRRRDA